MSSQKPPPDSPWRFSTSTDFVPLITLQWNTSAPRPKLTSGGPGGVPVLKADAGAAAAPSAPQTTNAETIRLIRNLPFGIEYRPRRNDSRSRLLVRVARPLSSY